MSITRLSTTTLYNGTGLQGIGNWSQVTATTGSPTTGTYTDGNGVGWKYYKWTAASGSVTVTTGVIDVWIVGGGSAGGAATWNGIGGAVVSGVQPIAAGTHNIVRGAGGSAGTLLNSYGAHSALGTSLHLITQKANSNSDPSQWGAYRGATGHPGPTTSITGTSEEYSRTAASSPRANYGDGGTESGNTAGSTGVVIIRVPTAFALA